MVPSVPILAASAIDSIRYHARRVRVRRERERVLRQRVACMLWAMAQQIDKGTSRRPRRRRTLAGC